MGAAKLRAWTGFVPVMASQDLRRAPVRVAFEDTALALFRDHTGRAAGVLDRCPHRFAPLSAGSVRPDGRLACGYHGWHFDRDGNGKSPSEPERTDCNTIAFRVVEKDGVVFVAPPGSDAKEPIAVTKPEGEWITRPAEPRLLSRGRARAGELRLARLAPAIAGTPRFRPFRVSTRTNETEAITSWTFVPEGDHELLPFRAGQHVLVRKDGMTRSYSLSDASSGESYRISVKRVGQFSSRLHEALAEGGTIELSDPAGDFVIPDADGARPIVLVAGGVGITPLFAMMKEARPAGRSVTLLYAVRHERDVFRRAELTADVRYFVSSAGQRIDEAVLAPVLAGAPDLFVCGPEPMIDDVIAAATRCGLPPERIHHERFRPALGAHVAGLADCDVTFARSKRTVRWSPNDGSLLELADKHGVALDSGCRVGSCGTCRVAVASGETIHGGATREKSANGCLVCVAVPRGDVVLDV